MNKQEIFQKINDFNNQASNPAVSNSKIYQDAYLYVSENIAKDRAEFFGWIRENDEPFQSKDLENCEMMDLAFGSGNLSSHIVLDNDLKYSHIYFNDKIEDKTHQEISIGFDHTTRTTSDFLVPSDFGTLDLDLVIFNPQIGGSYTDGKVHFEGLDPIIFDGGILAYLESEGIDVSKLTVDVSETNKSITIHSKELTKTEMRESLKSISLFNYYDVFYQSKKTKLEGNESNIVKFRKTLDSILKEDGIIVFYGDKSYFDILFADFDYVVEYWAENGNHLFVATKTGEEKRK
ncbi:MAG: hypothetical protein ACPG5P_07080, partial [Saprospiraceae bacterium]